jgi:phosphate transport system permease protein
MAPPAVDFVPKKSRRLLGPIFLFSCLIATMTGVVVLAVLLFAVFATVARAKPDVRGVEVSGAAKGQVVEGRWRSPGEVMTMLGRLTRELRSSDPAIAGFRAGIAGSLWLLGLVFFTAIPIGVGAAVFLEEYAPPGRLRRFVQTNIANLAAVPSIVYGILGLAVFVRGMGVNGLAMGPVLWAGGLTLSLLVLPVVVIATQESLRTVPISLRQAAMALGATKWQLIRDHVLPSSLPGILTGAILALSRAIGETAPLLMVGAAAGISTIPRGLKSRFTALPVEIYNYATEPGKPFEVVAAGGILLLLVLLLTMNATAIIIRNRYGRSGRG